MNNIEYPDTAIMIRRLELWTSEFVSKDFRIKELVSKLKNYGISVNNIPPEIMKSDLPEVTALKKEIIGLHNDKQRIIKSMDLLGALFLDENTMEVLIMSDSREKFFLSWQPGEKDFFYCRDYPSETTVRKPFVKNIFTAITPTVH
jgi:hypothetical protein